MSNAQKLSTAVAGGTEQWVSPTGSQTLTNKTLTDPALDNDLNFTGAGNRITGDFSNATVANQVAFQTSTTNGVTSVNAIPNGTQTISAFSAHNNSNPVNSHPAQLISLSTEMRLTAAPINNGSGTYLPMTFWTGGSERLRIATDGNVSMAGTLVMGSAYSFRNKIINGGCQIGQRASATLTGTPAYGGVDRWLFSNSGSGITSASGLASNAGWKSGKVMQLNGSWTSGATTVAQRIESSYVYEWRLVTTVAFQARVYHTFGSATNFNVSLYKANSLDTFSSVTQVGSTSTTLVNDSTATIITGTFTLATNDSINGLELRISHDANTVSSKVLLIGDVQLEAGSVPTPFETRPYGVELALCQRYYQVFGNEGIYGVYWSGYVVSGQAQSHTYGLPVSMRIAPVGAIVGTWAVSNVGQPSFASFSTRSFALTCTASGTGLGYYHSNTTYYLTLSAEL